MTVTYTVGDTREVIKGIPDGSVDLIATSPPFLALRSYVPADHESKGDEIGSERNPAEFIDMLLRLTAEWGRVLAAHGSIAIELGDTYSGSGESGFHRPPTDTDNKWRTKTDTTATSSSRDSAGWPRPKSLALIPQLYAVALAYGLNPLTGAPSPAGRWLVRNVIVWHRPNPAVGALGDKVRPSTSYIVIATRSAKRWFDLTAVRTDATTLDTRATVPYSRHVVGLPSDKRDPLRPTAQGNNPAGAPPLDAWFDHYDGSHDTWTLTTQPSRLAHYAMWPAKLAERLILSMCPREVCRVCGEPRRRMETTEYVEVPRRELRGDAARSYGSIDGKRHNDHRATRQNHEGWTDCGCACPTCGGRGEVEFDTGWDQCMDCSSAPPYRPGLVLDPFAGSGTTLAVADLHGRDAIGIDFDARNKAIYPARYDEVKKALYGTPAPMSGQGDLFAEVVG